MPRTFNPPGVSFFAFQDIVTAVVGIFVLITLVMVLELLDKVDAASRTTAGDAAAITRLIDHTKADAERIELQLAQLQRQQDRDTQAIELSATVTEESLHQQIKEQSSRNATLSLQISVVERQLDDAEQRLKVAMIAADKELRQLKNQQDQLHRDIEEIGERIEALNTENVPLYNETLDDGRTLVIIRLGDHPQSSSIISMREGDHRTNRSFSDVDELIDAIKSRDRRNTHYMILIAPGGASNFSRLRDFLDSTRSESIFGSRDISSSIRYGFDVIGSDNDIKLVFEVDET